MGNLSLVLVDERTLPYSFFKYIFVNKSDYEDGKIEKELLIHEEAHCLQYHSVDIILIELIKLFFWFNPVLWLFRKEILLNHEYYADSKVLENNEATDYYKLLVNLVIQNNTSYLASNFKYSAIKNRLIMMTKDRPTHNAILRKIAAIPLFLIVGMTLTNGQAIKQQDNMMDFSGKWVLNLSASKSFLTEVASTSPLEITISQDKNTVTMDININTGNGNQLNRTEKYAFNESVIRKNTTGDKSTVLTCTPAPDGQSFSITEISSGVYNGIAGESKRISVYTLSNNGRNMIIKIDDTPRQGSITPEDENHEIRVFDKAI
jgi:hypothetical protein